MTDELIDATLMQLCNAFVAAVLEGEGEWTDALAALDKAIDGKVERYQRAAHFLRAKRAAILAESAYYMNLGKSLADKAKTISSQDDRMEQALLATMHDTGKKVIETTLGTLRIKKSPHIKLQGDMAVLVDTLPEAYLRRSEPEVNKKALLDDYRAIVKALLQAKDVDGSQLWDEEHAIAEAREKMPSGIEVEYSEGVGGF